jgi:hypothetical protein
MPPFCAECGQDIGGMKFCAGCGTKVPALPPTTPTNNNNEQTTTEPTTPSTPSAAIVPPISTENNNKTELTVTVDDEPSTPATPAAAAAAAAANTTTTNTTENIPNTPNTPKKTPAQLQERPVSNASSTIPRPRVDTTDSVATDGRPRVDTEQMSPEERIKHEEKKKAKFVAKENAKCAVCNKSVFKLEESLDSVNTVFHKDCLRCKTCKAPLVGRQKIKEENRTGPLTKGQYLIAKEGSDLGAAGDLFCEKHSYKAVGEVVKAQAIDAPARNDAELGRVASMRKEDNERARDSMQLRVGDSTPVCARCGLPIDKGQGVIASGLQRFHEACPSAEEAAKAIRTTRFFLQRAPDRLITTFTCDKVTKTPHTFLWDLNKDSRNDSLRKKNTEALDIKYAPDAQARAGFQKKLVPPTDSSSREFELILKSGTNDILPFDFKNPKDKDKIVTPTLNDQTHELKIEKFHFANGVLQTLIAHFKYDEATKLLIGESLEIHYEQYGEQASEISQQNDPLKQLKERLHSEDLSHNNNNNGGGGSASTGGAASGGGASTTTTKGGVVAVPIDTTPVTTQNKKPDVEAVKAQGGGGCCVIS